GLCKQDDLWLGNHFESQTS
ncbi:mCG146510, partial [Mus musculus]